VARQGWDYWQANRGVIISVAVSPDYPGNEKQSTCVAVTGVECWKRIGNCYAGIALSPGEPANALVAKDL
jgi:hypothetical protein